MSQPDGPNLPETVTLAQMREALAFLGVPVDYLSEVTFTPHGIAVTGPVFTSYGDRFPTYVGPSADGTHPTWTRLIPLTYRTREAAA